MVKRLVQSRTGEHGTCFRTALASILNLKEADVPDFPEANQDPGVDRFLKKYGLRYEEVPINLDDPTPLGYHFILGLSPRGGQHACIGKDGRCVMDPHPQDGTGRGLEREERYGLLLPLRGRAEDTLLSGKRLHTAAELLRAKHDEIKSDPSRLAPIGPSARETMYHTTYQPIAALVAEASSLFAKTKMDDDPVYWRTKVVNAEKAVKDAGQYAQQGDYVTACRMLEGALSLAHMVIDKMRNTGKVKTAKDALDKRARMHRALDCIMDRSFGKDAVDDQVILDPAAKDGSWAVVFNGKVVTIFLFVMHGARP